MGRKIALRRFVGLVLPTIVLLIPVSQLMTSAPRATAVEAPPPLRAAGPASETPSSSAVRFHSTIDQSQLVDISVDGRPVVSSLPADTTSSYIQLSSGTHTVQMGGTPLQLKVSLAAQTVNTVIIGGTMDKPFGLSVNDFVGLKTSDARTARVVNVSPRATLARINGKEMRMLPLSVSDATAVDATFEIEPDLALEATSSTLAPAKEIVTVGKNKKKKPAKTAPDQVLHIEKLSMPSEKKGLTTVLVVADATTNRVRPLTQSAFDRSVFVNAVMTKSAAVTAETNNSSWVRQVIVAIMLALLTIATLTTLAAFRQRALDDRMRSRLRGGDANLDELSI